MLNKTANSLLKNLRDEEIDYEEVEYKIEIIKRDFIQLEKLLGHLKTDRFGAFYRHLGFIIKDPYKFGEHNALDIINNDLPEIQKLFYEGLRNSPYLDKGLREECESLILNCEFDSAVRKAFIIFKERAINKFNLPSNLDGEDLINKLFSPDKGLIQVSPEVDKRKAFRNYCSGLYGYFRNSYAHNLVDNPEYTVDTVISTINMLLKLIDTY